MLAETSRWVIRKESEGGLVIQRPDSEIAHLRRYNAGKVRLTLPFGHPLPPHLEDLVDLAVTVYAVDRLIRRRPPRREAIHRGHRWWQRHLEIHLPVSSPENWSRPKVHQLLSEALGFLTEDRWDFVFVPRSSPAVRRPIQRVLFSPEHPVRTALFSGGLDSLAGLSIQLGQMDGGTMILVTVSTSSRLLRMQRELMERIHLRSKLRVVPVILPVRLSQDRRAYDRNERSQRARGFCFSVCGAVAALMAGGEELAVFENGIGSLNLPISAAQLGAESTRSTHPVALFKLEKFLHALLGREFRLRLPFLFATKGEMCSRLLGSRFADLALQTVSCDGFAPRVPGPVQCGTCTSCLLRRQALWVAGFIGDREPGRYRRDVSADPSAIAAGNLAPLCDTLTQVNTLQHASVSMTPWINLTIDFPDLVEVRDVISEWLGPISRREIEEKLTTLYATYCREWQQFPARPPGWAFGAADLRLTA